MDAAAWTISIIAILIVAYLAITAARRSSTRRPPDDRH